MKLSKHLKRKFGRIFKAQQGFTLVEVIVTIGICGFSMITILGLYSITIDVEKTSKDFFDQSLEVNTIRSGIEKLLREKIELIEGVEWVLIDYPQYSLGNINYEESKNLTEVEIVFTTSKRREKSYFLLFYNE